MASMKKSTRSRISPFTVNMIFEKIEEQEVLRSAEGKFRFSREEKVETVFPASVGEYLRELSSASYYSWFLHGQENGGRIRAQFEKLFSENPIQFVQEMAEKCRLFLCPGGQPALDPGIWRELLDELGKSNPLFIRDGDRTRQLLGMCGAAPQRVLTVLLLAAGMNNFSAEKYETVLSCWHLMDRDLAARDYSQPQELADTGEILYADGLREEALDSFRKAVRMLESSVGSTGRKGKDDGETAAQELLAALRFRIGEMFLHGDGCSADENSAEDWLEDSAAYGYLPAFQPLAMLRLQTGRGEKAAEVLTEGARRKDTACLRMLGNAYYGGDDALGIEKNLREAVRCYLEGACPDDLPSGDAHCQYMLGRILAENGPDILTAVPENDVLLSGAMSDPAFWLETAARGRNREAAVLLNRLQWGIAKAEDLLTAKNESENEPEDGTENGPELSGTLEPERICLLNTAGDRNLYFAGTLPAGMYSVQICEEESMAKALCKIVEKYISDGCPEDIPEILLMALDENEQKNMKDALEVLRAAARLHAQTGALAADHAGLFYLLSGRLRLYVCGRGEALAPVFDSTFTRMGDFYIPLYLCDREQMASAWLLDRMPLFIPALRDGASRMDTVIFGDHPGIVRLCKDAIAAAQISETPFTLTVVGENADELEEQLLTDCPGLQEAVAGVTAARPLFVKMRPESRRFQELMSVRPKKEWTPEDKELAMTLQAADYIVVYAADEDRNLTLSMFLREWYLKTDPSFVRLPFIAAYCDREERAEKFRTLSAGAEEAGFDWYNNYDIRCFGTEKQLFSYGELINGRLERRTKAVHLFYYGIMAEEGAAGSPEENRENVHRALHDYFSRQYNRDSSMINALALNYRLFSAGITFPDWHSYLAGVSQKKLAARFAGWLRAEDVVTTEGGKKAAATIPEKEQSGMLTAQRRLEVLSVQEHERWCRSMLSRGWLPAGTAQMQAYIQRGCTGHQLYLAKLHPFLCSWDELGVKEPEPTGMQRVYGYLLQQIRPGKEPSDIREIDRENVKMTEYLLRIE